MVRRLSRRFHSAGPNHCSAKVQHGVATAKIEHEPPQAPMIFIAARTIARRRHGIVSRRLMATVRADVTRACAKERTGSRLARLSCSIFAWRRRAELFAEQMIWPG